MLGCWGVSKMDETPCYWDGHLLIVVCWNGAIRRFPILEDLDSANVRVLFVQSRCVLQKGQASLNTHARALYL